MAQTPIPWHYTGPDRDGDWGILPGTNANPQPAYADEDGTEWFIAQTFGPQSEENAELIVRAVNAHDDLLLAAKEAAIVIAEISKLSGGYLKKGTCLPRLMAAIAKAEGRSNG